MRIASIRSGHDRQLVVSRGDDWVAVGRLPGYQDIRRLADLLNGQRVAGLAGTVERHAGEPVDSVELGSVAAVVDRLAEIWGAGLNYLGHSEDLAAEQPTLGPGSYLRPGNCLIGNGDYIELPSQSKRVTAEAELGLVIGTTCKNVHRQDWRSVVAGLTAVLDMTAEDAVRENPRYIPWSKGFDTFCSIGPVMVTLDEFSDEDIASIRISTVRNDEQVSTGTPADMKYDLGYLVEYFTAGRTFEPGTVICTGTPGAAVIGAGDTVRAVVEGVGTLAHPVR